MTVCLCAELPAAPIAHKTKVVLLVHPHEAKQAFATGSLVRRVFSNVESITARRIPRKLHPRFNVHPGVGVGKGDKGDKGERVIASKEAGDGGGGEAAAVVAAAVLEDSTRSSTEREGVGDVTIGCGGGKWIKDDPADGGTTAGGAKGDGALQTVAPSLPPPSSPAYEVSSYLLFPGGDVLSQADCRLASLGKLQLVVVDATWQFAKEMVAGCPVLSTLPRRSLHGACGCACADLLCI
jgi:hypothetical protein